MFPSQYDIYKLLPLSKFLLSIVTTGCIGAIDGSHIPIKAPVESSASYVNRKGFHSILLQGIVLS